MNKNFWSKKLDGIPNWVTLGNLFCGCLSISATSESLYLFSILWIFLGMILDFFDGYLARFMRAESPMGKELDSFSDLVSFGIAPSFLIYQIAMKEYGTGPGLIGFLPYGSWFIAIFSAIRLGRYNLEGDKNPKGFTGLPSPANALWICSIPVAKISNPEKFKEFINHPYLFFIWIALSSALLVSPISLFNLKFKKFNWKEDKFRFSFLVSVILLSPFLYLGFGLYLILPFILASYLLFSFFNNLTNQAL